MTAFFICIILIGIGITIFSLILMLAEKCRLHDYRTDLKEKKEDLIKVIEDADELISEMNRFSDYSVSLIEEKHTMLSRTLNDANHRIKLYDEAPIKQIHDVEIYEVSDVSTPTSKGKVLTFDFKRHEIIKLAKSGIDSTEIARQLNCGKGEIELVARIGRQL